MRWWLPVVLLLAFGALKEFRLTEPYLYNFQHDDLNISDADLNGRVYPVWTYSYLIALVPALLLTDVFLYKPVLVFEGACYFSVWLTLVFGKDVFSQQIGQALFGFATATEVAYFAYLYAKVDRNRYSKVTAWTRSALLAGKCSSYLLAQFFVLFHWGSLSTLNYVTLGTLGLGFAVSWLLPNVSWRSVVNRQVGCQSSTRSTPIVPEGIPESYGQFVMCRLKEAKKQVTELYTDWKVLKWSFWWAMTSCGEFQIGNYTQTLWGQLQNSSGDDALNGFIEAACPFISVVVILVMERPKINWDRWGELCLAVAAFVDFGLLMMMAKAQHLWIMYAGYVCFRVAYQAMITAAQFNLVTRIASNSFGFVFGVNTFLALVLQSILTAIVVDKNALNLPVREQFVVYAVYHAAIGLVFVGGLVLRALYSRRCRKQHIDDGQDLEAERCSTESCKEERNESPRASHLPVHDLNDLAR